MEGWVAANWRRRRRQNLPWAGAGVIVPLAENEGCWEVDSCGTGIREHLLEVLNYERWNGSKRGTSLGQKSVPKGEELETTTACCIFLSSCMVKSTKQSSPEHDLHE